MVKVELASENLRKFSRNFRHHNTGNLVPVLFHPHTHTHKRLGWPRGEIFALATTAFLWNLGSPDSTPLYLRATSILMFLGIRPSSPEVFVALRHSNAFLVDISSHHVSISFCHLATPPPAVSSFHVCTYLRWVKERLDVSLCTQVIWLREGLTTPRPP